MTNLTTTSPSAPLPLPSYRPPTTTLHVPNFFPTHHTTPTIPTHGPPSALTALRSHLSTTHSLARPPPPTSPPLPTLLTALSTSLHALHAFRSPTLPNPGNTPTLAVLADLVARSAAYAARARVAGTEEEAAGGLLDVLGGVFGRRYRLGVARWDGEVGWAWVRLFGGRSGEVVWVCWHPGVEWCGFAPEGLGEVEGLGAGVMFEAMGDDGGADDGSADARENTSAGAVKRKASKAGAVPSGKRQRTCEDGATTPYIYGRGLANAPPEDSELPLELMSNITASELLQFYPNHCRYWPALTVRLACEGLRPTEIANRINGFWNLTEADRALRGNTLLHNMHRAFEEFFFLPRDGWPGFALREPVPFRLLATGAWRPLRRLLLSGPLRPAWGLERIGQAYIAAQPFSVSLDALAGMGVFAARVAQCMRAGRTPVGSAEARALANPPRLPPSFTMVGPSRRGESAPASLSVPRSTVPYATVHEMPAGVVLGGLAAVVQHSPNSIHGEVLLWCLSRHGGQASRRELAALLDGCRSPGAEPIPANTLSKRKRYALEARAKINKTDYETEARQFEEKEASASVGSRRVSMAGSLSERNVSQAMESVAAMADSASTQYAGNLLVSGGAVDGHPAPDCGAQHDLRGNSGESSSVQLDGLQYQSAAISSLMTLPAPQSISEAAGQAVSADGGGGGGTSLEMSEEEWLEAFNAQLATGSENLLDDAADMNWLTMTDVPSALQANSTLPLGSDEADIGTAVEAADDDWLERLRNDVCGPLDSLECASIDLEANPVIPSASEDWSLPMDLEMYDNSHV